MPKIHGLSNTRTYRIWKTMNSRCKNPKATHYDKYGGRGISVCDRWDIKKGGSFLNFLEDMGECPDELTLERVDNDGNYTKENCKWVKRHINCQNRRIFKNNSSGKSGVKWHKHSRKWLAFISVDKKEIDLGSYFLFTQALTARQIGEIKYGYKHGKLPAVQELDSLFSKILEDNVYLEKLLLSS